MKERKKRKLNLHSVIAKYMLVFLLFGSILVMVTVSIQNDLAETTTENLTAVQEKLSLTVLENILGNGNWNVRDHMLYKGDAPIGDGTLEGAVIDPFITAQNETGSFVYSFIDSSLADEDIVRACESNGKVRTAFLRVAGSTTDSDGNPIIGTFLDNAIVSELEKNDEFAGRSFVEGDIYYCCYKVIRDDAGSRVGAIVAGRSIDELTENTRSSALNSSLAISVIILYTFFALFLFVLKWNRSLKRMEGYLTEIGKGDFPEAPLKISGGDELSEMADVINQMKLSLVEKERLRNELNLARTIQAELLPDDTAAEKLPESCKVRGFMKPAREVGGDLYDFFMIDDHHLGLVIADVSDKGAPAALFMATAKMCIKDNMMIGAEPGDVLTRVNNRLLENDKSGLFVTAWIGTVDLNTGHFKYALAGHPFPFIKRAGTGEYESLKSDRNLVLAAFPDFAYQQSEIDLGPGDRIFLYTDGLDEAHNVDGQLFGRDRIKSFLDEHPADGLAETVSGMKETVDTFALGREQFDDLTMLFFEYAGGAAHE